MPSYGPVYIQDFGKACLECQVFFKELSVPKCVNCHDVVK